MNRWEGENSARGGPLHPGYAFPDAPLWRKFVFRASYSISTAAITLGFSLRTAGMHNMPLMGSALVVANHQSYFDPVLVGIAARRELVYVARKTLFRNRFFNALISAYNAVPIDQDGLGLDGIRTVFGQTELGRAVLIFPEGGRTLAGPMEPFKPGIHLLIKKTKATIVPVGIAGAYEAWPCWRPYPIPAPLFLPARPGAIGVVIGDPVPASHFTELPRDKSLADLFDRIAALRDRAEKLRRHA